MKTIANTQDKIGQKRHVDLSHSEIFLWQVSVYPYVLASLLGVFNITDWLWFNFVDSGENNVQ